MMRDVAARRQLRLGLFDDVPVTNQFKYTFDDALNQLDVDRLRRALDALLDTDFWPCRGFVRSLTIDLDTDDDEEPIFATFHRPDLSLDDVRADAALADALALVPWHVGARVLRVRVIQLCDGHLLGVNISHAYADAHTYFRLFFAAWAARYSAREFGVSVLNDRSAMIPDVVSCAPLPSHFVVLPRSRLAAHGPPAPAALPQKTPGGSQSVRQLLHISNFDLRALVTRISCQTRLQALYALLWKAVGTPQLIFPADLRENEQRWLPKIAYGYAGNPLVVLGCRCDDIATAPVGALAQLFKAAVDNCTVANNCATLASFGSVLESGEHFIQVPVGEQCAGITSWLHCDVRPAFGDARPQCLWTAPRYYRNLIQITDGEPDGVDVHVHVDQVATIEREMRKLMQ